MKIGFIGLGNMATAIVEGLLRGGISGERICASRNNLRALKESCAELGIEALSSNKEVAQSSDLVFLCTKPKQILSVVEEVYRDLEDKLVVSIAAGISVEELEKALPSSAEAMTIMPNTPVSVGEGLFAAKAGKRMTEEGKEAIVEVLETAGKVIFVPDDELDIFSMVSGCGPAFVALLMEAFADGAVQHGLKRKTAYEVIGQVFMGTAKLMAQSGKHPGVLKDEVCSPGGTTIRGVTALEEYGARNACIKAVDAIMKK